MIKKIEYRLKGKKIYRDDEQIAKLSKKGKVKYLSEGFGKYRLPIDALLKREGVIGGNSCGKPKRVIVGVPESVQPHTEPVEPTATFCSEGTGVAVVPSSPVIALPSRALIRT